ncbi:MAG: hypothetical protein M3198_12805 [Actinomycetota bacterium]|nr:hypothetical protein [Actinomycetota bacterium]
MQKIAAGCVALAGVLMLAGCGEPQTSPQPQQADLLFLRSARGVAVFEAGSAAPPKVSRGATVTSSDFSTAVATDLVSGSTEVTAVDPSSGAERWRILLEGRLLAKLVSEQGDLVALSPIGEKPYADGRTRTELVIAGSGMIKPRHIVLEGNYEPEAFSTDGTSLFVIKYLPAARPTKYQVRRLDIDKGKVLGVYTPHEELQRPMGGTARIQVASPDGRRLYTLYTQRDGNGQAYAFIHVLALDDMWAHCISLPADFAQGAEWRTALTISPDGDSLYVASSGAQQVAEIDTDTLQVARTRDVELGQGLPTRAVHDSKSSFYFASGRNLTKVDATDLTQQQSWEMSERVRGVQASASGPNVYVGLRREVAVMNGDTGERIDTIDPPGVGRVADLGTGMRWLNDGTIKCGC